MEGLARQVSGIAGCVDGLTEDTQTVRKQLDHVDSMIHELVQFVDEHRPALSRALAFLEPGKGIRDYLKNRPKAGSHD